MTRVNARPVAPAAPDVGHLLDLADAQVVDDPYAALAACRATAPVGWHEGLGMYVATSHAACNAVLRDRALGRIFQPREPEDDWGTFNWLHADSILDSEPPKHTRLRRLIAGAFGRGHVQRLAPRIEQLAEALMADCAQAVAETGSVDVIETLAEPLPVLVIAELLGVPDADRHLLRPWSQAIVRMYELVRTADEDAAAQRACREFAAYVEALAADRARHPGEDLLSDLVAARDGSDRLSPRELVATAVLLLNAGHEASVNGFGNGLASLLAGGVAHGGDRDGNVPGAGEGCAQDGTGAPGTDDPDAEPGRGPRWRAHAQNLPSRAVNRRPSRFAPWAGSDGCTRGRTLSTVPTASTAPKCRLCLLYTSPSPRDRTRSRMPSSA